MDIIFLGNVVPPEEVGNYSAGSVAGNKMQYYLLKYLSRIEDVHIEVVSSYSHAAFPKDKKIFISGDKKDLFDGVKAHQLSYINLPIIKQWMLIVKNYRLAKKLCKRSKNPIIFSYDIYPMQGNALRKLNHRKNVNTLCLLADLSIGGVQSKRGLKKFLQNRYDKLTLKNMQSCSNYIVLNENIIKEYAPNSQYIIVQGGVEPAEFPLSAPVWDGTEKNLLYTGALVDYSGIMTLIEAMQYLTDTDVVLDIYGKGPLENTIKEYSKTVKNVRFHGSVSNEEILKKQRASWLLVNPRPVDNSIAKVTFPSKIFEYMMSGRPVLSTQLNGFTEEYYDKIFWVDDDSAKGLSAAILELSNEESGKLDQIAQNAYEFMIKHKTWEQNAKVIHDFLKEIEVNCD